MQKKHEKTLGAIFASEQRANIKWRDVESLLLALGAVLSEGSGSRVRIKLDGHNLVLHRPHPSPVLDKGAVKTLRLFLRKSGVKR